MNDNHNSKERPIKLIFSNCVPRKKISRRRKSKDDDADTKKRKRQRKNNKGVSEDSESVINASNEAYDTKWCRDIPREIIYAIFKLVVRSEGIVPFLSR